MSDVAIGGEDDAGLFRVRTIALMLAIGIIGFLGMLILGAYAPDFRSGHNGGAHALSNAATGYSALVELAAATGRKPRIVRDTHDFSTEDLLVLTPEGPAADLSTILLQRVPKPTLIVLPKWRGIPDREHRGWSRYVGLADPADVAGVLAPRFKITIGRERGSGFLTTHNLPPAVHFRAPHTVQTIAEVGGVKARQFDPLIVDSRGRVVLAMVGGGPLFVLADPDLLSNHGLKDVNQASAALAMLDWLNANPPQGIAFDVSLNGLGRARSPLKLIFEPPFLAMTLTILAALILAGIHALNRFGAPRPRVRAIAFGKAALVNNSAMLIRKARREAGLGGRYASVIRERATIAFGVPVQLRDTSLDAYLDALKGANRFTDLVRNAEAAEDRHGLLAAARALHAWQKEKMR